MRTVLILLAITVVASSFKDLGKKSENSREEYVVLTGIVYGLLGTGLVLWWPTPDVWSAIGKWVVLGSFVFDWAMAVIRIGQPRLVRTRANAVWECAHGIMWLVCAVALWPA